MTRDDENARKQEVFHVQDSYLEHGEDGKPRCYSSRPAYQLEGHYLPLGTGQVLHGYVPVSCLKAVCKQHGVSITGASGGCADLVYLAGVSGWKEQQACRGPESAHQSAGLFGSDTMANFFAVTMIGWLFRNPDILLEVLLQKVSSQMDRKIEKRHTVGEHCVQCIQ